MRFIGRALPACAALGAAGALAGADAGAAARAPPAWAHPSPYDAAVPAGRFADVRHLREARPQWDLPLLYALWQAGGDGETWPWVWCQRNPTGPHHVYVGLGAGTLEAIRAVSAASASNNITVVLRSSEELARHGASEAQLCALRCAVIYGRLAQVDADSRLLMLDDERILAFDSATLA